MTARIEPGDLVEIVDYQASHLPAAFVGAIVEVYEIRDDYIRFEDPDPDRRRDHLKWNARWEDIRLFSKAYKGDISKDFSVSPQLVIEHDFLQEE